MFKQEKPWEKHGGMTAAVIFVAEEQIFKAWYMAGHCAVGCEHVQCLALSPDGIHWECPSLGTHEALGSKDNNTVIPATHHGGQDHWESMLKDRLDPDPTRRYKAISWSIYDWNGPRSGIYSTTSPDGIHWSYSPDPIFLFYPRRGLAPATWAKKRHSTTTRASTTVLTT